MLIFFTAKNMLMFRPKFSNQQQDGADYILISLDVTKIFKKIKKSVDNIIWQWYNSERSQLKKNVKVH